MSDPTPSSRVDRRHEAQLRRRRLFVFGGAAVLVVAAVVVAVVLLSGGSDDGEDTKAASGTAATTATTGGGTDTTATTEAENKAKPLATGVCSADQLLGGPVSSGVRGTRQVVVVSVTNQTSRPCTLNGAVASITLVGEGGAKQPAVVTTGGEGIRPDLVAQEIKLEPFAQASMVAAWAPVQSPTDTAPCVRATAMQMTMPASKGAVDFEGAVSVCSGGAIAVSPLQPGIVGP